MTLVFILLVRQLVVVCHGRVEMMSGNNDIGTYMVGVSFCMSITEELQDIKQDFMSSHVGKTRHRWSMQANLMSYNMDTLIFENSKTLMI